MNRTSAWEVDKIRSLYVRKSTFCWKGLGFLAEGKCICAVEDDAGGGKQEEFSTLF